MVDLKRASKDRSAPGGRPRRSGNRPMDKLLAIAWACILIVLVLFAALYLPWSELAKGVLCENESSKLA